MSYFDPRLALYAVVWLATVLIVQGLYSVVSERASAHKRVNKRMRLLQSGVSSEQILSTLRRDTQRASIGFTPPKIADFLDVRLTQAGMTMSVQQLALLMGGATVTIGVLFPILGGISGRLHSPMAVVLLIVFAVVLGIVLPLMLLSRKAAKRIAKFEAQFPVALDIFVRGLRAGHPVSSALELLVSEMPDPIGSEFGIVIAEMNYGYDLRGALANLAKRVRTQDIQMFVVSVAIQSETGGNLANILEGLAKVIRDRANMVLKVRALASEGKMTGMLLSILPVGTFVFTFATEPRFYLDVIDDSWFMPGVCAIAVMYTAGILIMNKMIKIKV